MTTLVLQSVGSAVGFAVGGPIGATLGGTLGAVAGAQIDQQLFGPDDVVNSGPRLESTQVLTSREGAPVPRAYGRVRLSGEII